MATPSARGQWDGGLSCGRHALPPISETMATHHDATGSIPGLAAEAFEQD